MNKPRIALLLSFATQYVVQIVGFISVVIIARLLTPEQIGIYSVAIAVVSILAQFRTFGVGTYIVQEPDLTATKMRAATTVLCGMSWTLGALLALGSPFIAEFYNQPALRAVILVLACNFLLVPFNSVVLGYLNRQMAFGKLFKVSVTTKLVDFVVLLSLAFIGFGYMSMAWASLAATVAGVVILNIFRPDAVPFLPGLKDLRSVLSFGSLATAAGVFRQIGLSLPELIIGRMMSMEAVAFFSRGFGVVMILNRAVTGGIAPVLLPHFSGQHRKGEDTTDSYLKIVSCFTSLAWPFYGFVFFMSYPVIRILYGDQWDAAVPVAQGLCGWGFFVALSTFAPQILTAVGAVKKVFVKELTMVAVTAVLVLVGIQFGLGGVVAAFVLVGLVEFLVCAYLIRQAIGVGVLRVLAATRRSMVVTLTSMVVPATVALTMDIGPGNLLLPFLLAAAGGAGGWFVGAVATRHDLLEEGSNISRQLWRRVASRGV